MPAPQTSQTESVKVISKEIKQMNTVEEYFKTLYQNIQPKKIEIEFIAVSCENAVAVGNLSSVILKYNKIFDTQFATIFKVQKGKIVKYHFMEDSYRLHKEME